METLKIKTTITEKRETEKEIQIPYYSKDDNHFFKVYADQKTVNVYVTDSDTSVSASIHCYEIFNSFAKAIEAEPSTEEEFNAAFEKALYLISKNVDMWVTCQKYPEPEDFERNDNSVDVNSPEYIDEIPR